MGLVMSVAVGAASPAAATLIGDSVVGGYATNGFTPSLALPGSYIVGNGQESVVNVGLLTNIGVDFSATRLNLEFDTFLRNAQFTNTSFDGLVFRSAGFADITSFAIDPASTLSGFGRSNVTLTSNELRLDFGGLRYADGQRLGLAFTFGSTAPEPSAWALMIVGFGLVGTAARRRRRPVVVAA